MRSAKALTGGLDVHSGMASIPIQGVPRSPCAGLTSYPFDKFTKNPPFQFLRLQKKKRTDPTRTTQTSNKQDDRSGHNVVEALLTYDGEGYTIDWTKLEQKLADQQTTLMIRCPHDLVGKICI